MLTTLVTFVTEVNVSPAASVFISLEDGRGSLEMIYCHGDIYSKVCSIT